MDNAIDIVLPWVDGNDLNWRRRKEEYNFQYEGDKQENRFRDWDNLQYWFRAVEKNLPWVRKIHFVTWGHIPKWLNIDHPKINIVRHEEYIPEEYLPTFNSHVIELNLHRINQLSEQFIYANDDTFFLLPMKKEEFFANGRPCDCAQETIHQFNEKGIDHIIANNLEVINSIFSKKNVIKENRLKWYSLKYGKGLLKNLYLCPCASFTGFENLHLPNSFLKSSIEEIWKLKPEKLDETSRHRFRTNADVNQWLIRYYQLCKGNFQAVSPKRGKFFSIGKDDELIKEAIINSRYKMICLSDDNIFLNFEEEKLFIQKILKEIFPNKSSYEK